MGKDLYHNLTIKAPWNEALYRILKELYTEEEAGLIVRMPYNPSSPPVKKALVSEMFRSRFLTPAGCRGQMAGYGLADRDLNISSYIHAAALIPTTESGNNNDTIYCQTRRSKSKFNK